MRLSACCLACMLALLFMPAAAVAEPAASLFDTPLYETTIPLKPDRANPQAKPSLSCFYYPGFMVKQIDRGEKGAEQLSILPLPGQGRPDCNETNAASEKVVDDGNWRGYFKGVKGNYIFFDADDGANGGVGFAIFTPDSRKLAEDVAVEIHAVQTIPGGLLLKYRRVYSAPCSLVADTAACWEKVQAETDLSVMPADCATAYASEQERSGISAAEMATDPSVVEYEVETAVENSQTKRKPAAGQAVCRPAI